MSHVAQPTLDVRSPTPARGTWVDDLLAAVVDASQDAIWQRRELGLGSQVDTCTVAGVGGSGFIGGVMRFRCAPDDADVPLLLERLASFESFRLHCEGADATGAPTGLSFRADTPRSLRVRIHDFFRCAPLPRWLRDRLARRVRMEAAVVPDNRVVLGGHGRGFLYTFLQQRHIPTWMRSGPGLFGDSVQTFRVWPEGEAAGVELMFGATPAPSGFLAPLGIDPLALTLRVLRLLPVTRGLADRLQERMGHQMMALHNEVHLRLLKVLMDGTRCGSVAKP